MAGCDASAMADPDSIVDLERQLARLECVLSRAVRAFEVGGEWAPEGAKSPSAWLATRCRLPKAQARAQLRRGRALDLLPLAASAWGRGEIGGAHLDALAKVRTEASAEALGRDEALLVKSATELRFEPYLGVLAYWGQLADPEGAEEADLARRARRDVYLDLEHLGHVPRPDDPRPHLGGHRGRGARAPRGRALRGRLGQRTGRAGPRAPPRRAGPHPEPAPGRRPRRDGHPLALRPGRGAAPGAPLQRPGGLRGPPWAHL